MAKTPFFAVKEKPQSRGDTHTPNRNVEAMLNPPDTLKALAFPYHDWPEKVPPSQQLVALYLTLPSHRENVHRMAQLLKAGATAKAFMNHPHLGLRKLGNWHKDRAKSFARAAHRGPHSPELEEWPAIAWHLGGSMPFCVELDNLKDTDAPIHQPAAMLVAAD